MDQPLHGNGMNSKGGGMGFTLERGNGSIDLRMRCIASVAS